MRADDNNRWYDKYPDLRKSIKMLKGLKKRNRDEIIQGMKDLISNRDKELIAKNAIEFPLECKRRWYDTEPYSCLVINSLKYADDDLITDIILYLKEKM